MTVEDMLTETIICGSNEVNSVNGGYRHRLWWRW